MVIGTFVEYRGFTGTIEYDPEDRIRDGVIYRGSLLDIEDSINYHTKFNRVEMLFEQYKKAVDRYIETKTR